MPGTWVPPQDMIPPPPGLAARNAAAADEHSGDPLSDPDAWTARLLADERHPDAHLDGLCGDEDCHCADKTCSCHEDHTGQPPAVARETGSESEPDYTTVTMGGGDWAPSFSARRPSGW